MKTFFKKYFYWYLASIFLFYAPTILSQNNISIEELKSAFIFQIIKNIEWQNEANIDYYKIAIVGSNDALFNTLKNNSQKVKIKNKPFTVTLEKNLQQLTKYDVLYITEDKNYLIQDISLIVDKTNTLLITENASDKTNIMINLISKSNETIEFEINKPNLVYEGMKLSPNLLLLGGSEIDIVELFKQTTKKLNILKQNLKQQTNALNETEKIMQQYQTQYRQALKELEKIKADIENQARLLNEKNRLIELKNISIRSKAEDLLSIQAELDGASFALKTNQDILGEKLETIASKEKQVLSLSDLIRKNESILNIQNSKIKEKELQLNIQQENLSKQSTKIKEQKTWLFISVSFLIFFGILLLIIIYFHKERKKVNLQLTSKNLTLSKVQSELMIARDRAQDASKAKSSFLANMSHEIRTPMNAIIGMLHLIKQTQLTAKQNNYINKVDYAADNLLKIINDILDFSKVESGELRIENTEFSLSELLDKLTNLTGLKIQEKKLELVYDVATNIPNKIFGDPLRLSQVLINLTNNAMKFTERGEIKLSVSLTNITESNVELEFTVSDTGIGMSKTAVENLFKPFIQADSSTTRKFGGTGLGLAICKSYINKMGGDIQVISEEGYGSRFQFNAIFAYASSHNLLDSFKKQILTQQPKAVLIIQNESTKTALSKILTDFQYDWKVFNINNEIDFENLLSYLIKNQNELNSIFTDSLNKEQLNILNQKINNDKKIILLVDQLFTEQENHIFLEQAKDFILLSKPFTPHKLYKTLDINHLEKTTEPEINIEINEEYSAITISPIIKRANILLVEDNPINQEVAKETLRSFVKNIDIANNGKEAVEMFDQTEYDCILMDIQMPIMDGYKATQEIRATNKNIPIIAMTANAMEGDKEKCIQAGMNDYISKPIQVQKLFEALRDSIPTIKPTKNNFENINCEIKNHIDLNSAIDALGDFNTYLILLKSFKKQQNHFITNSERLLKEKNFNKLSEITHDLKGVSANLFINSTADLAAFLEDSCNEKDIPEMEKTINQLNNNLSIVFAHIDELENTI